MKPLYMLGCVVLFATLAPAQGPAHTSLPKHAILKIGDNRFHGGGHRLRFSPDGKTLAIASDEKIRLLDPATGSERLTLLHLSKSVAKSTTATRQDVVEFTFFANGKSIASADYTGVLRIWNLDNGKETRLPATHAGVASLCISADEKSLFTAGFDGVLNEWQIPAGILKQTRKSPDGEAILAIATLGKQVAGVTRDGTLFHWDPAAGKDVKRIELGAVLLSSNQFEFGNRKFPNKGATISRHSAQPRNVEFSPDGKRLAQIQGRQIWDVETGKVLTNLTPTKNPVRFAFSHDNKSVIAAPTAFKEVMQVFDCAAGAETATFDIPRVDAVAFAPDGKIIAFAAENRIRLWNPTTKQVLGGEGSIGAIKDWDVSPDGKEIALVTKDKMVRLFDLTTGKHKESFATTARAADMIRFQADGKSLVVGVSLEALYHFEKKAGAWQASKTFPIKEQLHDARGPGPLVLVGNQFQRPVDVNTGNGLGAWRQGKYSHFTFSPDGRHLLVAAEVAPKNPTTPTFGRLEKEYQLYQLPSLKLIRSFKPPARGFVAVRFSNDGRLILIDTSPVQILEVLTGAERMAVTIPPLLRAMEFGPNDDTLMIGTSDGGVAVLGLPKGEELYRAAKAHGGGVNGLRTIRGGHTISVASDQTIVVWDADLAKRPAKTPLKLEREDFDLFLHALDAKGGPNVGNAMSSLIAGGDSTIGFLKTILKPATAADDIPGPKTEIPAARIREHRALEILERIGSPVARAVLEMMAKGHAGAASTTEAAESLSRLSRR